MPDYTTLDVLSVLADHGVLALLLGGTLYGVWHLARQVITAIHQVGSTWADAMQRQAAAMEKQAEAMQSFGADLREAAGGIAQIQYESREQTILMNRMIKEIQRLNPDE